MRIGQIDDFAPLDGAEEQDAVEEEDDRRNEQVPGEDRRQSEEDAAACLGELPLLPLILVIDGLVPQKPVEMPEPGDGLEQDTRGRSHNMGIDPAHGLRELEQKPMQCGQIVLRTPRPRARMHFCPLIRPFLELLLKCFNLVAQVAHDDDVGHSDLLLLAES